MVGEDGGRGFPGNRKQKLMCYSYFSVNSLFGQSRHSLLFEISYTFFCLVKNSNTEVFQLSLVLECHTLVCVFRLNI